MNVNERNYHESIDNYNGSIIFWAPWDKTSKEAKERLYQNQVQMEFNIDEAPNIPVMLGIDDIPRIAIFEKGELIKIISEKEFKD
jgi:thioredoxin-like negative regulator of GroEL